ncbi:hypothetical protein NPIL_673971, partial [Nephila pilipes]
ELTLIFGLFCDPTLSDALCIQAQMNRLEDWLEEIPLADQQARSRVRRMWCGGALYFKLSAGLPMAL